VSSVLNELTNDEEGGVKVQGVGSDGQQPCECGILDSVLVL